MKASEKTNPSGSAAKPAPGSGATSAEQRGSTTQNYQSLKMLLTKQSGKIGTFKVIVWNPWTDSYTYDWEGKHSEATAWRCGLVSAEDPAVCCIGEYKLTTRNKVAFEKHVKAKPHGTTLLMSTVSLVESAKTQYMSCSVRVTVNMASTSLSTVSEDGSAVQPVPKTTVAETKQIQQNQNFDLTAFILSRSQVRNGGEARKAFNLELADGSKDEASGKVQTMFFTVFASEAQVATLLDFADKCI